MQVRFGDFVLDRGTRQLLRDGQERRLGPKAFGLLERRLSHRPNVVAKERIRDRIWPDTFVAGSTLATVVAELREALDEDPKQPLFLRTVHGVGYAFCGEARDSGPSGSAGPGLTAAYRLVLGDREVALRQGENVLGRVARRRGPGMNRRTSPASNARGDRGRSDPPSPPRPARSLREQGGDLPSEGLIEKSVFGRAVCHRRTSVSV